MLCAYIYVSYVVKILMHYNCCWKFDAFIPDRTNQITGFFFRSTFETPTLLDGYDRIQTPFLATSKLTGKGRVLTAAFPTPPAPATALSSSQPWVSKRDKICFFTSGRVKAKKFNFLTFLWRRVFTNSTGVADSKIQITWLLGEQDCYKTLTLSKF